MFSYVNIIGYGYVGGSIGFLCRNRGIKYTITDNINKIDSGEQIYFNNILETIKESEANNEINFYFICVPTPSDESGGCDTTIVENVFNILSQNCSKKTIIIIKSTVVPGTTRKLHITNQNNNIFLYFCPEFLTEKNAENDVLNESKVIIGCSDEQKNIHIFHIMSIMYSSRDNIHFCLYEYAELMKYTINVYLAQKVTFFNQIYEICEAMNISYEPLRNLVLLDSRISSSHTSVPGHDKKFGFGGSCLVKETMGMKSLCKSLDLNTEILDEILSQNTKRRFKEIKNLRERFCQLLTEDCYNCIFPSTKIVIENECVKLYLHFIKEQLTGIEIYDDFFTYTDEDEEWIYFQNHKEEKLMIHIYECNYSGTTIDLFYENKDNITSISLY